MCVCVGHYHAFKIVTTIVIKLKCYLKRVIMIDDNDDDGCLMYLKKLNKYPLSLSLSLSLSHTHFLNDCNIPKLYDNNNNNKLLQPLS